MLQIAFKKLTFVITHLLLHNNNRGAQWSLFSSEGRLTSPQFVFCVLLWTYKNIGFPGSGWDYN